MSASTLGRDVRSVLQSSGLPIPGFYVFDFYLYFPNEVQATSAANDLRAHELAVSVEARPAYDTWLCLARCRMAAEQHALDRLGELFETVAGDFEGEFDGWEAGPAPS